MCVCVCACCGGGGGGGGVTVGYLCCNTLFCVRHGYSVSVHARVAVA